MKWVQWVRCQRYIVEGLVKHKFWIWDEESEGVMDKSGDNENGKLACMRWDECEGDWLDETGRVNKTWFQSRVDAYRSELLLIFNEEPEDGGATVTISEERMLEVQDAWVNIVTAFQAV